MPEQTPLGKLSEGRQVGTDPLQISLPALALQTFNKETVLARARKPEYLLFNKPFTTSYKIHSLAGPTCIRAANKLPGSIRLACYWPSELSSIIDKTPSGPWHVTLRDADRQNYKSELQADCVDSAQTFCSRTFGPFASRLRFACSLRNKWRRISRTIAASRPGQGQSLYHGQERLSGLACTI